MHPVAGTHYPGTLAELLAWFPTDETCADYLDWLRWSSGFTCPRCGGLESAELSAGMRRCRACMRRVSVTSGTMFHRTRTPLTVWFQAAWHMTTPKIGVSALGLQRTLELGSYQTAWSMLHRYRRVMVRPGRDLLKGRVEVDETYIGGVRPGKRGRGAAGKALVAVAVEANQGKGFGRARLQVIPDAKIPTLRGFIRGNIEPGSTIVTDGFAAYKKAIGKKYTHQPHTLGPGGGMAGQVQPGVHRVASLVKRWLVGVHQGAVEVSHLQEYLDEFVFRFNRRNSRRRGMLFYRLLEQAIEADPITYRDIVANPQPATGPVKGTPGPRRTPRSIVRPDPGRPWRTTTP